MKVTPAKKGRRFIFDWPKIQSDFDSGLSKTECIKKYGVRPGGWAKAVSAGHMKVPSVTMTLSDGSVVRKCAKCQTYFPTSNFHQRRERKEQFQSWCKPCISKYAQVHVLKKYGLSQDEYRFLAERSGGRCEGCGRVEIVKSQNGSARRLAIDHDHSSGRVRGLLCNNCNRLLGLVRDDKRHLLDILNGLVKYLERDKSHHSPFLSK